MSANPENPTAAQIITQALNATCKAVLGEHYDSNDEVHEGNIREWITISARRRREETFWRRLSNLSLIEEGKHPKLDYIKFLKKEIGQRLKKNKEKLLDLEHPSREQISEAAKDISYTADIIATHRLNFEDIRQVPDDKIEEFINEIGSKLTIQKFKRIAEINILISPTGYEENREEYNDLTIEEKDNFLQVLILIAKYIGIATTTKNFQDAQQFIDENKEGTAVLVRENIIIFEHLLAAVSAVEKNLYRERPRQ